MCSIQLLDVLYIKIVDAVTAIFNFSHDYVSSVYLMIMDQKRSQDFHTSTEVANPDEFFDINPLNQDFSTL